MPGNNPFAGEPDPLPASSSADSPSAADGRSSFGAKAARLSWQLPIAGMLANIILGALNGKPKAAVAAVLLVVCLVGAVAAIAALISISRCGWRRILFPACIGLLLNGFILYLFVVGMAYARIMMERG